MIDCAGCRVRSAWSASSCPTGVSQQSPASLRKPRRSRGGPRAESYGASMVPGEFGRVDQGPEQVGQAGPSARRLVVPARRAVKCDCFFRARPAGEDGQVGGLDGLAVVGSEIGDLDRGP